MRLFLIRPNMGRLADGPYIDEGRMEPLQLGLLAALCPPDVEVSLFDDRCEEIPFEAPTDLVAITVETFTARRAYEIAAVFRKRGVPVILGGMHPSLLPAEAALYADSVVVGDAETVWKEVLNDFRTGVPKPVYRSQPDVPQTDLYPRRDLFRGKGYLPVSLIQFGRGCGNSCSFCAISAYFHQKHSFRQVSDVVRELADRNHKLVFFVDDNIVANPAAAKGLFKALIPLRIRWVSQATIDMVHDGELMDLMCESGCLGNVIGFESIDPQVIADMGKYHGVQRFDKYEAEIAILREYGLQTWAAFTLGYDSDTPEGLYSLLEFAMENKFTFAAFNVLMPYPGTPFYERLKREDRLLFDGTWWNHPDFRFNHATFRPAQMSPDQLTDIAFDMRAKWNSASAIIGRFLEPRTNMRSLYRMAVYWMYNPLFRREVFRKQGVILGGDPRRLKLGFKT